MSKSQQNITPDQQCPCGSEASFSSCCHPFITGETTPDTPEQLMRSRYTAYVLADMGYIEQTTQQEVRAQYDFEGLKSWADESEWLGLKVHDSNTEGENGRVRFTARYRQNDLIINHSEDSLFTRHDGRWYFVHGKDYTPPTDKTAGRNDPCPCGSGKKFKKCCLS